MSKVFLGSRHIDCDWLHKITPDSFICCDARGAMKDRKFSLEESLGEGCKFFHKKIPKRKLENMEFYIKFD